jgi:hypothetical protein
MDEEIFSEVIPGLESLNLPLNINTLEDFNKPKVAQPRQFFKILQDDYEEKINDYGKALCTTLVGMNSLEELLN